MSNWKHGSLIVATNVGDQGTIEFIQGDRTDSIDMDKAGIKQQMAALDELAASGWEVVGSASTINQRDRQVTSYLLRLAP